MTQKPVVQAENLREEAADMVDEKEESSEPA
jgi:hypothetical protein